MSKSKQICNCGKCHRCRGRLGGKKRALAFTREYQMATRAHVRVESLRQAGHKGAVAVIEKYGRQRLYSLTAAYYKEHPTSPVRRIMRLLEDLGYYDDINYKREYILLKDTSPLDIAFPCLRKGIEVNGKVHYLFNQESRRAYQTEKIKRLEQNGWHILVIEHDLEDDDSALKAKLQDFLNQ